MSHTGALLAASDSTVDALFRQSGVIRTDTLEQLFDVATLLANQPVPAGNRVAIVTNAGGLGILCADTCEANGLAVTELSADTVTELRSFLPAASSVSNPVDMIASASAEDYGRAIRVVAGDPGIDALIVIYIPPLEASAAEVARQLVGAIADVDGRIPVLSCFMSARGLPEALRAPGTRIPSYRYPEQAAIALARAVRYGMWRGRARGTRAVVRRRAAGGGRRVDRRRAGARGRVAPDGRGRAAARVLRHPVGPHGQRRDAGGGVARRPRRSTERSS